MAVHYDCMVIAVPIKQLDDLLAPLLSRLVVVAYPEPTHLTALEPLAVRRDKCVGQPTLR